MASDPREQNWKVPYIHWTDNMALEIATWDGARSGISDHLVLRHS